MYPGTESSDPKEYEYDNDSILTTFKKSTGFDFLSEQTTESSSRADVYFLKWFMSFLCVKEHVLIA